MPGAGIKLKFFLNKENVFIQCPPGRRLVDILRNDLGQKQVREGCGKGECGACLVLMDGSLVNSCLIPAFRLVDSEIVTLEGLVKEKIFAGVKKIFAEIQPFECGCCAPGMQMAIAALKMQNPNPTREEIREALSGNICRCAGYGTALEGSKRPRKDSRKG